MFVFYEVFNLAQSIHLFDRGTYTLFLWSLWYNSCFCEIVLCFKGTFKELDEIISDMPKSYRWWHRKFNVSLFQEMCSFGMARIGDIQRQVNFTRMEMAFIIYNSLMVFLVHWNRTSLELKPQECGYHWHYNVLNLSPAFIYVLRKEWHACFVKFICYTVVSLRLGIS